MNYLDKNGRIPTYKVQDEYALLESLSDDKPSKRIVNTKKGLKAINALIDLEKNHNASWYSYLKERNKDNMQDLALFYRGNKITFFEMFQKADEIAISMANNGLNYGDEIGVCVSNTPELVYIILAANKIGLKVNLFGASFDKEYISLIIDGLSEKVLFISDDNYNKINDILENKKIENIVITSLADSIPEKPEKCDEYEAELDSYYHYFNYTDEIVCNNKNAISLNNFIQNGKKYSDRIEEKGDLETDFLVTYTSGSTKIGYPKEIIHKNRSLITMGRFHDPELCGNPKIPGLRGLAHIHPESNTDVITCISDNLMQGWSVALEPEYSKDKALEYVILNKPNYLDATTSFIIEMAKQYLIDKRFHKDGNGKKLPFLLATFAVGEGTQKGEEKFINKFLRESKAGSGVSIKGLKLPFTTLSVGGGDCEHGGIYYTLWKSLYQKLYSPIIGKNEMGLLPVPYVVVTALKQNEKGQYEECSYNEFGIVVANSYTNLSGYKNNVEETNNLIIEDNLGRKWVSTKTYGYIDKIGGVHIKGRIPEKTKSVYETFQIDDIVTLDTKNILSSTTVSVDGNFIINLQFQPLTKINEQKVYTSLYRRLLNAFPKDIIENIYIRNIPTRESFVLTDAGKRNVRYLEMMAYEDAVRLSDVIEKKEQKIKKLK